VLLVELGREGAPRLLVHAPFFELGDMPRFLTQRFDGAHEPGRPLRLTPGDGERGQFSQAPDRQFLVDPRVRVGGTR